MFPENQKKVLNSGMKPPKFYEFYDFKEILHLKPCKIQASLMVFVEIYFVLCLKGQQKSS